MKRTIRDTSAFSVGLILLGIGMIGCAEDAVPTVASLGDPPAGPFHVYEGDDIQQALNAAALATQEKTVIVHAGTYGPQQEQFAYLQLLARHDGVHLIADGEVTLTAVRQSTGSGGAEPSAVVNHVIYCGDGLTQRTIIEGFTITGADGFASRQPLPSLAGSPRQAQLQQGLFYRLDGGALKVFGQSSLVIRRVTFKENVTRLCGGAVSIEQQGFDTEAVAFVDCLFRNNRCPGTGAAIDVLERSTATLDNCLFVGNIANYGMDRISRDFGLTYNAEHGSGALTVFPRSTVRVTHCTFTNNWNGIDDHGVNSVYADCLLWNNTATDGSRPGEPYEFDIIDGRHVTGCAIGGVTDDVTVDLRGTIDLHRNHIDPPAPDFDADFRPQHPLYDGIGYRPTGR